MVHFFRWQWFLSASVLVLAAIPLFATQEGDQAKASLGRVLILGDSISMGYLPFVQQQLEGIAMASRPSKDGKPENCQGTTHGIQNIDRWLSEAGQVDLIFFNFGLHDLKRVDAKGANSQNFRDPRQAEPETYAAQLTGIVERLEQTGAKLIFVTTTPVPTGGVKPWRSIGDPQYYNALARLIVEPRGIEVLDLYGPALEHPEWQRPVDVHFKPAGSDELAKRISQRAREHFADPESSRQFRERSSRPWEASQPVIDRFSKNAEFNYDESRVPQFDLPSLLTERIPSTALWSRRRPELLEQFTSLMYGRPPVELDKATVKSTSNSIDVSSVSPGVVVDEISLAFELNGKALFQFPCWLYRPRGQGPFPAIVLIHNREAPDPVDALSHPKGFMPIEMLTQNGFAVAVFQTNDVEPDRADAAGQGIRAACVTAMGDDPRRADYWGCLTAWAWGASRILDVLEGRDDIDTSRTAIIGHSRGGKTALWAGAIDERFTAAISNNSGCAGAALSRRAFGETVGRIGKVFPYWFAPAFSQFVGKEEKLPFDQHGLIALIAPRKVCVGSADEDLWADPRGEFESFVAASEVFELFETSAIDNRIMMPGLGGQIAIDRRSYHIRPGVHDLTEGDWLRYIRFLKIP